jgi:hypothetical protein
LRTRPHILIQIIKAKDLYNEKDKYPSVLFFRCRISGEW